MPSRSGSVARKGRPAKQSGRLDGARDGVRSRWISGGPTRDQAVSSGENCPTGVECSGQEPPAGGKSETRDYSRSSFKSCIAIRMDLS